MRRSVLLVLAGIVAALSSCAQVGDAPASPGVTTLPEGRGDAEVIDSGPDCFADDVLRAAWGAGAQSSPDPRATGRAPTPGDVPASFTAVQVVECRLGLTAAGDGTYEKATYAGEVDAFVQSLALPDVPPPATVECLAMERSAPEIYLVDSSGRALRPTWPMDECMFVREPVRDAFADLELTDEVEYGADVSLASTPAAANEAGPDCFAEDILREVDLLGETALVGSDALLADHPPSAPTTPGPIPADFEAAHVVLCRVAVRPSPDDPFAYEAVTLTGDMEAVTRALAVGDIVVEGPRPCDDALWMKPQLFLVDQEGLTIRPTLPIDECGRVRSEVTDALGALDESGTQVYAAQ